MCARQFVFKGRQCALAPLIWQCRGAWLRLVGDIILFFSQFPFLRRCRRGEQTGLKGEGPSRSLLHHQRNDCRSQKMLMKEEQSYILDKNSFVPKPTGP